MTAEKSGLVVSKVTLIVTGVVVVVLIITSGLIGHFAFPYEVSSETTVTSPAPEVTSPAPEVTSPAPIEVTDYRLPTSLVPTHYKVELKPFVNGNFSILGRVVIDIKVMSKTSNITIHMADIITFNDTIKVMQNGNEVAITKHTYDPIREFYVGYLEKEISAGETIQLEMSFEGYLNDQMRGFYRSSYVDESGKTVYLAGTQFQPTDARRAFPCFDEPALKAQFTVSLAREKTMATLSNMPLSTTEDIDDNWVWDHYEKSVDMSTYLVAFMVSNFESRGIEGKEFKVWARSEAIYQADYALDVGPKVLTYFENYFGIDYALPKVDMVAITDFSAGAMENWGLILYRETAMLYDPYLSSASNKQRVGLVITHELAHQWFGNLVSPAWWEDLWLNEGFATYMEFVGLENAEPTWKMEEQFLISTLHDALSIDSLESSHAIRFPVGHPDTINEIFDSITYSKGASLIRMMEHFLTNEIFKAGLATYMKSFEYKAASQEDLWQHLNDATVEGTLPASVKEIMDTWTLQMGYPVVTVTRKDNTFTLSQSRFLLAESGQNKADQTYTWWIPISYTTLGTPVDTETLPKTWLGADQSEITITKEGLTPGDGLLVNVQATGYYRVNYDDASWANIIATLNADPGKLPVTNRAQLIDDAMALARSGKLSYDIALSLTNYLYKDNNEVEYVPWSTAKSNFAYLERMMQRSDGYELLQTYIRALVEKFYNAVDFTNPGVDHLVHLKRTLIVEWACKHSHQLCEYAALGYFQPWIQDQARYMEPNAKATVLCTGIAKGSLADWDALFAIYTKSNVATEKDQILQALGCSQDAWNLYRYLERIFTEEYGIRKQDASTAFKAVATNKIGNPLAWSYLKANWLHISNYLGSFSTLGRLVTYVSEEFNTAEQKQQLEQFFQENKDALGTATMAFEQAIEGAASNVAWMEKNYDAIVKWLTENKPV
ncbi:aminopeptidase N-like [Palaemon carinicauda]|uniref:aminopeptidase N-like n=1 Tax=Palaemon carinicauda TaxID=392227 RepID=UPI0035B6513E